MLHVPVAHNSSSRFPSFWSHWLAVRRVESLMQGPRAVRVCNALFDEAGLADWKSRARSDPKAVLGILSRRLERQVDPLRRRFGVRGPARDPVRIQNSRAGHQWLLRPVFGAGAGSGF